MTKGELTRQRLVSEAAKLFNQRGYDGSSMLDVMEATGLEKGGIYRHFASMDELGLALVEESVQTLRAMLREAREDQARRANPEHLIARSVAILVEHVRAHRRHFAFIVRAQRASSIRSATSRR